MSRIESFPPIVNRDIRVLVLGSMPGVASLDAVQYYAHPRNGFWPIMGEIFGFDATVAYERRLQWLLTHKVGLWDVVQQCSREGSLDSRIEGNTVKANAIWELLVDCGDLSAIFFNGKKSAELFQRHCKQPNEIRRTIALYTLPSTSPANAALSFADKLVCWRDAFTAELDIEA